MQDAICLSPGSPLSLWRGLMPGAACMVPVGGRLNEATGWATADYTLVIYDYFENEVM
jgi:hypothetical protein